MRKKICFVVTSYNDGGGTERVVSQISNGLLKKGYDISILSLGCGKNPHFYTSDKIALYELRAIVPQQKSKIKLLAKKIIMAMKKASKICNALEEIRPDVVIAAGIGFYRYIEKARKKIGLKTIAWEHFCLNAYDLPQINKSRSLAIKNSSKVILISEGDLFAYKQKYPNAENLKRIYNPVAFEVEKSIDINNKVVVAAGRYVHEKGFDMLIEAWSKIANEIADWELRIFGEGPNRVKLQKQIDDLRLENVKLCGYAQELDQEYKKASIFCLTSRYEGWGLVLVEAQAKGLPCVSFDCENGPREIIQDGLNGFLVQPNDTNEFADKLLCLIKNNELRKSFASNSQSQLYKFKTENIINEWDLLIKEL